jgi:hypothetical protein
MHVVQAWMDFLQSFGLQEQQLADLLRSTPELFYTSNIFQVRPRQRLCASLSILRATETIQHQQLSPWVGAVPVVAAS